MISSSECKKSLLPIKDALEVVNGKWKLHIIASLLQGNKRFKELQTDIENITAKMLSQELKNLEMHELVRRTVYDSTPVYIEYGLTEYGHTLRKLFEELYDWGSEHRKRMIKSSSLS